MNHSPVAFRPTSIVLNPYILTVESQLFNKLFFFFLAGWPDAHHRHVELRNPGVWQEAGPGSRSGGIHRAAGRALEAHRRNIPRVDRSVLQHGPNRRWGEDGAGVGDQADRGSV